MSDTGIETEETSGVTRPGRGAFEAIAPYYDHLMRHVPYKGWVDYVEALVRRWKKRPRRVLDLACGTGRVGSEMRRRGYEVYGADLSEPMARHCARQTPPLPAVVCDAAALAFKDETFELIVCLYDSLNYILEPAQFQRAMAEAHRVLRPEGLFIFDMNTIRALATLLFTQARKGGSDPLEYDWRAHWDPWQRLCRVEMWFAFRSPQGRQEFREIHYQRGYTLREIADALRAAGFQRFKAYDAYRFTPVTPWSDRVFFVARKE